MKSFISTFFFLLTVGIQLGLAQGCVAIRSSGSCSMMPGAMMQNTRSTTLMANYRYFRSFRHFRGDHEEKERLEQNTEVINWNHTIDLSMIRTLNSRWSIGIGVPVISNVRSSLYEHGGNSNGEAARHKTKSFGLGDARLTGYYNLIDPARMSRWTLQGGLGIKLPTGDYKVEDLFYKSDGTIQQGPVDQSIQLGDGGTGVITELNVSFQAGPHVGCYANAFYLINPREQNGVSTRRGSAPTQENYLDGTATMSVPDQFMTRIGVNWMAGPVLLSLGGRLEGIPVYDLIGGSSGFRRPGYIVSVEPGLFYQRDRLQFFMSLPWALVRNRTQSVPDKNRTIRTGTFTQGDAAFADWTLNVGLVMILPDGAPSSGIEVVH